MIRKVSPFADLGRDPGGQRNDAQSANGGEHAKPPKQSAGPHIVAEKNIIDDDVQRKRGAQLEAVENQKGCRAELDKRPALKGGADSLEEIDGVAPEALGSLRLVRPDVLACGSDANFSRQKIAGTIPSRQMAPPTQSARTRAPWTVFSNRSLAMMA